MNDTRVEQDTTRWPEPNGMHMKVRTRRRQRVQDVVRRPDAMSDVHSRLKSTGRSDLAALQVIARLYTRPGNGVTVP